MSRPEAERWPTPRLVEAAQAGDRVALEAVVTDAYPHLRRFAGLLCPTRVDAEDAAQDAVLTMWRELGALRTARALAAWSFQIVRHECVRRARLLDRTRPVPDVPMLGGGRIPDREPAERVSELLDAIAALPADQRTVLVLRDIQGYSGRATADAVGLSLPAMKSRLHRARATVRAELGPA